MTKKDDGGPAFPRAQGPNSTSQKGISMRDWFAGQALAFMMTKLLSEMPAAAAVGAYGYTIAASGAYGYADAMLAERAKEEDPDE